MFYCISTIIGYIILFEGAQAKFFIPGVNDKIPYTHQTFVVLLVPTFLGAPGFISVLAYVITGAVGFPVFAGLTSGVSGATAGFLIGFCIAAAFIAIMVRMGKCRTVFTIAFTMLSASGLILSAGWIGYSKFINRDWATAFRQAVPTDNTRVKMMRFFAFLRFFGLQDKKRKKNRTRFFTKLERLWQRMVKEISDTMRKGCYL